MTDGIGATKQAEECAWGKKLTAAFEHLVMLQGGGLPEGWARELEPHLDCAPAIHYIAPPEAKKPRWLSGAERNEDPLWFRKMAQPLIRLAPEPDVVRVVDGLTGYEFGLEEWISVSQDVALFARFLTSFCEKNPHECCGSEGC